MYIYLILTKNLHIYTALGYPQTIHIIQKIIQSRPFIDFSIQ